MDVSKYSTTNERTLSWKWPECDQQIWTNHFYSDSVVKPMVPPMLILENILQFVSPTADASHFSWRLGYKLWKGRNWCEWWQRRRWQSISEFVFWFRKDVPHSMRERGNQLRAKLASHWAWREMGEKATMLVEDGTYARHLLKWGLDTCCEP